MNIITLFRRKPAFSPHDEFHRYTADIMQLNKQRDGLLQKMILMPKAAPGWVVVNEELERCHHMIAIAQKAIIKIKEGEARENEKS